MFELKEYQRECDSLTLNEAALAEALATVQQTKGVSRKPLRAVMLAAALVASLCLSVAAADLPVAELWGEIMVRIYPLTEHGGEEAKYIDSTVRTPQMSYAVEDGHSIFTVDGIQTDVTEAMEQDGFYNCEWDGATLHLTADGLVTLTRLDEAGDAVVEEITLDLFNDGAVVYRPLEGEYINDAEAMVEFDLTEAEEFEQSDYTPAKGANDR